MNTPKIRIGSAYQPARREVRGNNGELRSYRSWLDPDSAKLQSALLQGDSKRFDWEEALACVAFLAFMVLLIVGLPMIAEVAK